MKSSSSQTFEHSFQQTHHHISSTNTPSHLFNKHFITKYFTTNYDTVLHQTLIYCKGVNNKCFITLHKLHKHHHNNYETILCTSFHFFTQQIMKQYFIKLFIKFFITKFRQHLHRNKFRNKFRNTNER